MSISEREQQMLDCIEGDLDSTGPKLAAMMTMFTRLAAAEEMPAPERIGRTFEPSCLAPVPAAGGNDRPTGLHRIKVQLDRPPVWLGWLVVAVALVAVALTWNHSTGQSGCPQIWAATCQPVTTHVIPAGSVSQK